MTETCHLQITSLTSEGEGIGSLDGYKIFVHGALPEETVEIVITERRKNFGRGQIIRILKASSDRIIPICPIFGSCGGCQIMHLAYSKQLAAKWQRVVDAMTRIAHLENALVLPCVPSPLPLHYRNKIQLPIRENDIGLFKKGSHDIIPLEKCYIHCEEGETLFYKLKPLMQSPSLRYLTIKNAVTTQESLVILVTNDANPEHIKKLAKQIMTLSPKIKGVVENINQNDDSVIFSSHSRTLQGRPFIFEKLCNKQFRISAPSFFQVNTPQAMHLISYVIEKANIKKTDTLLDAYCGVGTFSLFAADFANHVIGTEIAPSSISDARENARLNDAKNTTFHVGKAEELMNNLPHFDMVFLNPPRKGCAPELIDQLLCRKPSKILYISCDPATLARDIKRFVQEGGYQVISIQPFDMFPQTMHVETVVLLSFIENTL